MAQYTDYTEKTEPVDTDLALIYDTPAKVNKKFTFGNLWKWIAKKIVSEGISQLETTNKTIPGAINELNKRIRQFKVKGVYDNPTKTITFSISQLKNLHGLVLFKTTLSNNGRHLRLSLTAWTETVISQHTQNSVGEPTATGSIESGTYKLEYKYDKFPSNLSGICAIFFISDE